MPTLTTGITLWAMIVISFLPPVFSRHVSVQTLCQWGMIVIVLALLLIVSSV